jgi:hypothetical protein
MCWAAAVVPTLSCATLKRGKLTLDILIRVPAQFHLQLKIPIEPGFLVAA